MERRENKKPLKPRQGDNRSQVEEPGREKGRVDEDRRVLDLSEEQLVADKRPRQLGEIVVRKEVDSVPARLEVEASRDEVEVLHEPVGQTVSSRQAPWEEDGALVLPIYEEQLVVTRRLVLRERLRVRRITAVERQLFEDTVKRERLVVEDPQHTGRVREVYPTDEPPSADRPNEAQSSADETDTGNPLTKLITRALE